MDIVFTIVSRNYAAQAATLMESVAQFEPQARRVVIASDGDLALADANIEVINAETQVPGFGLMCAYYDALELNTAIKPHAFAALIARDGVGTVTYLDPDIVVYRPLDEVREGLARAPLVLTPHLTRPLRGNANPDDHVILTSGAYNLGFMAVRSEPQIADLLAWWAQKCQFDCRVDFAKGLFTDQKWMDLAPGMVSELGLIRSPALNLAYWNLDGRSLNMKEGAWQVDDQPLGFFHFSGFDPARPELLSKHQSRIAVEPRSPLAGLLKDYAARLLRHGHAASSQIAYGHGNFPSGRLITPAERRRMLEAAQSGQALGGGLTAEGEQWLAADTPSPRASPAQPPPGPWLEASVKIDAWLTQTRPAPAIAALLAARSDLRSRFADDADGLLVWLWGPEASRGRLLPRWLPAATQDLQDRAVRLVAAEERLGSALERVTYGLRHRAHWPADMARDLTENLNTRVADLSHGMAFPRLFFDIWQARPDLQRRFALTHWRGRFGFLRWLIGGGLAEQGIAVEALPRSVRRHPAFLAASLSVRRAKEPAPRAAPVLTVVEVLIPQETNSLELIFEAGTGRFLRRSGAPAPRPSHVETAIFQTEAGLVPADAMALIAQGVAWSRAEGPR